MFQRALENVTEELLWGATFVIGFFETVLSTCPGPSHNVLLIAQSHLWAHEEAKWASVDVCEAGQELNSLGVMPLAAIHPVTFLCAEMPLIQQKTVCP